jgi:hypothetical protein
VDFDGSGSSDAGGASSTTRDFDGDGVQRADNGENTSRGQADPRCRITPTLTQRALRVTDDDATDVANLLLTVHGWVRVTWTIQTRPGGPGAMSR